MRARDAVTLARFAVLCLAAAASIAALSRWDAAFSPSPLPVAAAFACAGALVLARGAWAPGRIGLATLAALGLLHAVLSLAATHVPSFPGSEWLLTPLVVAVTVGLASGATVATWSSPVPAFVVATAISVGVWIAAEAHYGLVPPPTALGCLLAVLACFAADVVRRAGIGHRRAADDRSR